MNDNKSLLDTYNELIEKIDSKISTFEALGRTAKHISKMNTAGRDDVYQAMYQIVEELMPVESIVYEMYPDLIDLFEALVTLYGE